MKFGTAPGLYAIEPQALGLECFIDMARNSAPHDVQGQVAVVHVHGPLSYAPGLTESYGGVLARVRAAFADSRNPHTVVMHLDSPGGDVAGCFDHSRMLRASVPEGKRLVAYSDSKCCSSSYALALASSEIYCGSTAIMGSIGVICAMQSFAAAADAQGVQVALITSGKRKADGNPMIPISDEAIAASQMQVDVMAGEFFRLTGESRAAQGLTAEAAQALEAGVFVGAAAQSAGLVDGVVVSLEDLIATLQSGPVAAPEPKAYVVTEAASAPKDHPMADENTPPDEKKEDAVRAALVTAAESDDPDKAKRAKSALAAYDGGDDEDKKDKDEEASAAVAAAAAAPLAAQVQALSAEVSSLKAVKAAEESAAFYAAHPELTPELRATLQGMPLVQAKAIVATLPKAPAAPTAASLAAQPGVVAGETQGDGAMRSSPAEASRIAAAFGEITPKLAGVEYNAGTNIQTFGRVTVASKAAK